MTASLSLRPADDDIDHLTRKVPRTRTSLGDRSFTVTGPRLWNNLPLHLRDSELALLEFHRLLMTHLTTATSDCCCFLEHVTHLVTYLFTYLFTVTTRGEVGRRYMNERRFIEATGKLAGR